MRRTAFILLLVLCPLALGAGKKKGVTEVRRPDLTFEVPVRLAVAHQRCGNYAWAAALETLLAVQNVNLDQEYWVDKADGGRCVDDPVDLDETARLVDGEYTLPTPDGGIKARLTTTVSLGPPAIGEAVLSMKQGRAVMVLWNQHPYVLRSVRYDEFVRPTGERRLEVRQMSLLDPVAGAKAVSFRSERDNPAEITGTLSIKVEFCPMNTITCP